MGSLAGRFSDVLLLHNCPAGVSDVKVGRQCEFKSITHDATGENDGRAQVDLGVIGGPSEAGRDHRERRPSKAMEFPNRVLARANNS